MKISRLNDHKLLTSLGEVLRGYISKCDPHDKTKDPKPSAVEIYCFQVIIRLGEILSCLDQIHLSIDLLSGYRRPKNSRFNRADYITFGIENYYIRYVSVYDRCLRFTNFLFNIGLPEKECRENTIIKNENLKNTEIAKRLKEMKKIRDYCSPERNKVIHSETFDDTVLSKLKGYYLVEDDPSLNRYKHIYKTNTDRYIREKREEFGEKLEGLENCLGKFFDAVYAIAKQKIESIDEPKRSLELLLTEYKKKLANSSSQSKYKKCEKGKTKPRKKK